MPFDIASAPYVIANTTKCHHFCWPKGGSAQFCSCNRNMSLNITFYAAVSQIFPHQKGTFKGTLSPE
jgi:hypothetical protein